MSATAAIAPDPGPVLSLQRVRKEFGGLVAIEAFSLDLFAGEIVALVGDNGAGKSTLVKLISGVHQPTAGSIAIDGEPVSFADASAARRRGIEVVYQDLALADSQPVFMNMFLGRELVQGPLRRLDKKRMASQTQALLNELDVRVPSVKASVRDLSGGQRQGVAIARATHWATKLVLMDEPTAALGVAETAKVEQIIRGLRARNLANPDDQPQSRPGVPHRRPGGRAAPRRPGRLAEGRRDDRRRDRRDDHRTGEGVSWPLAQNSPSSIPLAASPASSRKIAAVAWRTHLPAPRADAGLAKQHGRHVGDHHAERGAGDHRQQGTELRGQCHGGDLRLVAGLRQEEADEGGEEGAAPPIGRRRLLVELVGTSTHTAIAAKETATIQRNQPPPMLPTQVPASPASVWLASVATRMARMIGTGWRKRAASTMASSWVLSPSSDRATISVETRKASKGSCDPGAGRRTRGGDAAARPPDHGITAKGLAKPLGQPRHGAEAKYVDAIPRWRRGRLLPDDAGHRSRGGRTWQGQIAHRGVEPSPAPRERVASDGEPGEGGAGDAVFRLHSHPHPPNPLGWAPPSPRGCGRGDGGATLVACGATPATALPGAARRRRRGCWRGGCRPSRRSGRG